MKIDVVDIRKVTDRPGYFVSRFGHVLSDLNRRGKRGGQFRELKQRINKQGYCVVQLRIDRKNVNALVHRLIAEAWCEGSGDQVNHKDLDKRNNIAANLEWCSRQQNIDHAVTSGAFRNRPRGSLAYQAKLTEAQVLSIRADAVLLRNPNGRLRWGAARLLARKYEVPVSTIASALSGKAWKHVPEPNEAPA